MTLEGMERAWKSQGIGKLHGEVEDVIHRMERSHRWQQAAMTVCVSLTLASTVAVGIALSWLRTAQDGNIWLLLAMQAIAIAAVVWLARMRALRQRRFVRWGMPLRDAVTAALRDIQGQVRETKFGIGAGGLLLALTVFAVDGLNDSGKMNAQAVTSFATLVFVIVGTNAVILTRRWRHTLRPQSDRLRTILAELDSDG
jgi:membrane protein YdbS with pleckstrin-like domain